MEEIEIVYLVAGLLILGEALALYVGLFVVGKGVSPWITTKNKKYLTADAITGVLVLLGYVGNHNVWYSIVSMLVLVPSIVFHFRRTIDFLLKREGIFCANKGLFFVNNLKLVVLFGLLFMVLPF